MPPRLSDHRRTTFAGRTEIKTLVDEPTAAQIVRLASVHMKRDVHVDPGKQDQITTSMYLDSPDRKLWKLGGTDAPNRFKLRLRQYGNPPNGPVFVEKKQKQNGIITKQRAEVDPNHVGDLLDGKPVAGLKQEEKKNLGDFMTAKQSVGAQPTVLLRTRRYSLVDPTNDETRLTFDRDLAYFTAGVWRLIPMPKPVLVEWKWAGQPPPWMVAIMQALKLQPQPMSKFDAANRMQLGLTAGSAGTSAGTAARAPQSQIAASR